MTIVLHAFLYVFSVLDSVSNALLKSVLNEFNIFVISYEFYFFVPSTQSCIRIIYYVRTYISPPAFDAELIPK